MIQHEVECHQCQNMFAAMRPGTKFCSDACRAKFRRSSFTILGVTAPLEPPRRDPLMQRDFPLLGLSWWEWRLMDPRERADAARSAFIGLTYWRLHDVPAYLHTEYERLMADLKS